MVNIYPQVVAGVALGTLAAKTALKIASSYEAAQMSKKTLLKTSRLRGAIANMTSGQGPILIGLAYGEASVTMIKTALEQVFNPEKGDEGSPMVQQAENRVVLWESLEVIPRVSATAFNLDVFDSGKRVLGGGKGLPFLENVGWQIFVYNLSNAPLTTASTITVLQECWGVFLQ